MNRNEKIQLLKALQAGKINTDRRLRPLDLSSENLVKCKYGRPYWKFRKSVDRLFDQETDLADLTVEEQIEY